MGRTVTELRRCMTRREFYTWLVFAKTYPVFDATPPVAPDELTPETIAKAKAGRT